MAVVQCNYHDSNEEVRTGNSEARWMPVIQASALGMVPLTRRRMSPVPHGSEPNKRVVINVSGRRYETWQATLSRHPDSLLSSKEREYFLDANTGEYVFNRDPDIFRHILNYYRTGRLHFSYHDCSKAFKEEFRFFRIPFDGFDSCCWNEVNDSHETQTFIATTMSRLKLRESRTHFDTVRETIWDAFENPHRTRASRYVYNVIVVAVALSLVVTTGQSITCNSGKKCGEEFHELFLYTDGACAFIFTVEYAVKLYAVPHRKAFVKSLESFIDILAILPFYFDLLEEQADELKSFSILRVFRVFRVFKLLKNSKRLKILLITFRKAAPELGLLCFIFSMGVIMFATCVYYTEKNEKDTGFTHIPLAIWYAIITSTTIGYGDMCPTTVSGKLISAVFLMLGVLVVSLPVPFIEGKLLHQQHLQVTEDRLAVRIKHMMRKDNRSCSQHQKRMLRRRSLDIDNGLT